MGKHLCYFGSDRYVFETDNRACQFVTGSDQLFDVRHQNRYRSNFRRADCRRRVYDPPQLENRPSREKLNRKIINTISGQSSQHSGRLLFGDCLCYFLLSDKTQNKQHNFGNKTPKKAFVFLKHDAFDKEFASVAVWLCFRDSKRFENFDF